MRRVLFVALVVVATLSQGCLKQVRTKPKKKQVVQMGPMVFYTRGGKVVRMEHLTPEQLFTRAANHYKGQKYKKAEAFYKRIVQYHTASSYFEPALYNYGLTLEKRNRYAEAAEVFRKVMMVTKDKTTQRDAHFRMGAAQIGAKQWEKAVATYQKLDKYQSLNTTDRIEVYARWGVALQEKGDVKEAVFLFRKAISFFRRSAQKEYLGNDYFTSMAHFRLGLIHDRRFRTRKFRLKQAEMKQDLDAKANDLLTAQAHYMRAIRMRNPEWVVAALFRIGDMYRQMYNDMMHAPIPKDLKKDEVLIYRKMLKKKIRVLLTKANYAFERNIQTAQVLGMHDNGWIDKTRKKMQEIRDLILKEYYSEPSAPEKKRTAPTPTQRRLSSATVAPRPAQR